MGIYAFVIIISTAAPPQGNTEWIFYRDSIPDSCRFTNVDFVHQQALTEVDTSSLPFSINSELYSVSSDSGYSKADYDICSIIWKRHMYESNNLERIRYYLLDGFYYTPGSDFAASKKAPEKISISGKTVYRMKTWFRGWQCDAPWSIGPVTTYFLPSDSLDYLIITCCVTYTPGYEEGGVEEPAHYYPNRINEFEQVIEQTFRIKE